MIGAIAASLATLGAAAAALGAAELTPSKL